ncbi:MAG: hypothetical protein HY553_19865 [Elusimicrobia bacterium]|nr:hypothetical protein [Elusimicrobiota bacterium]
MNRLWTFALIGALAASAGATEKKEKGGAPESSTASSDLYPNDFGPAELDVSEYPKAIREGYKLTVFKCAACHTAARPLNSQFLELTKEEEEQFKKDNPDVYKDKRLVHIEDQIWKRYVKRMMSKPGCPVKGDDGKKIWQFLAHDSKSRKTGKNAGEWAAHRKKLLDDFKKNHKDAYQRLFPKE